ncbi:MAG: HAD family hydrolase [Mycoplasma sp.]
MSKIFIFDLDGTLLNSEKKISKKNIHGINALIKKGYVIIIATGRNFSQVQNILEDLIQVEHFILLNGGCYWNNHKKEIKFLSTPLSKDVVQQMLSFAKKYKRELQFSNFDRLYRVYFGKNIFEDIKEPNFFHDSTKNPVFDEWNNVSHLLDEQILRIAIRCEKEYRKEIIKELKQTNFKTINITESSNTYVEVDPIGISKYNAVKNIIDTCKVDESNIFAFGDSENDISLLSNIKNSIVMDNANSNVKKYAKEIIGNNNSDSIANFINKFI